MIDQVRQMFSQLASTKTRLKDWVASCEDLAFQSHTIGSSELELVLALLDDR